MDINEGLDLLAKLCANKTWFHQVGMDEFGRFVVYAHYMNLDIFLDVPDKVANRPVLIHFTSSKEARREQFTSCQEPKAEEVYEVQLDDLEEVVPDLNELTKELDRLEKMCGSNIMQDIFYEVHDGVNSVTDLSTRFPEVRRGMETLYNKYGFDLIYEEMDG